MSSLCRKVIYVYCNRFSAPPVLLILYKSVTSNILVPVPGLYFLKKKKLNATLLRSEERLKGVLQSPEGEKNLQETVIIIWHRIFEHWVWQWIFFFLEKKKKKIMQVKSSTIRKITIRKHPKHYDKKNQMSTANSIANYEHRKQGLPFW